MVKHVWSDLRTGIKWVKEEEEEAEYSEYSRIYIIEPENEHITHLCEESHYLIL